MHLISPRSYHVWRCTMMLIFSLSFISIALFIAWRSLVIMFPVLRIENDILKLPRMIFASKSCYFPYTGNLWNSLPPSVFSSLYSLSSFNCWVYQHLTGINRVFFYLSLNFSFLLINCRLNFLFVYFILGWTMLKSQWNLFLFQLLKTM